MVHRSLLGILAAMTILSQSTAAERVQSRSMVISQGGVAATEHPLATQAATRVMEQGGNAIDAAIAANAVMNVVSPMMCGVGGDLFAIVYEAKTGKIHGLNASGWSPAALTPATLKAAGVEAMPIYGPHSVTVPGAVDGWHQLRSRFGSKSFRSLLAPAIQIASEGFPVTELVADYWASGESILRKDPSASATYLPNGHAPKTGDIFRNPDLAATLRRVASRGRDGFYKGPAAKAIVEHLRAQGGVMDAKDLAEFSSEWVEPISTTYRGWTVYEIPPNGQGIAALMMLNIMERFPFGQMGHNTPKSLHAAIEAKKLAYADMLRHVADPKFSKAPISALLSKTNAATRAAAIDPAKASCQPEPSLHLDPGPDTTYLCVVDRHGNMVSLIQSVYYGFGSGLVPPGTGIVLQNRGGLFSLDPTHPNLLAPRKRPLHTIIPALMVNGGARVAFGIMGGWNQSQAHAQFVSNLVDHGMNIQAAVDAPRFTKATFEGCDVSIESRVPAEVTRELESLGHLVKRDAPYSQSVGGGQAVMRDDAKGVNFGASDPRKDGAALAEWTHR